MIIALLSGCDQINTIKEYFTGSGEETVEVEPITTEKPIEKPQTVKPSNEAVNKPLGPNEIARVGKWVLTQDEFQERLNAIKEAVPDFQQDDAQAKAMILEELLRQELIYQDAMKKGIAKDKDIVAAVEEFSRQLVVRQALAEAVKNITATEEEIKAFYDENKDALKEPGDWRIREIVVEDQATAEQIRNEIIAGADFAEKARERSKAETASNGGDLGFISQPTFPTMGEALAGMNEGDITPVFAGPNGFYIMKVEEQRTGRQLELDEIKGDIEQAVIMQKQQESIAQYIQKLTEDIKVEVNENLLK
jgi:peptidyl-prolyl cis-trans isomerase C